MNIENYLTIHFLYILLEEIQKHRENHCLIQHIKTFAKNKRKENNQKSPMQHQQDILEQLGFNNMNEAYTFAEDDILNALLNNKDYIYDTIKNDELVCLGKNSLGLYLQKDLNKIKGHMCIVGNPQNYMNELQKHKVKIINTYEMPLNHILNTLDSYFFKINPLTFLFINHEHIKSIEKYIKQARASNIFFIFTFTELKEAENFLNTDLYLNNIYEFYLPSDIYHAINQLPKKEYVNKSMIIKTPNQIEHIN